MSSINSLWGNTTLMTQKSLDYLWTRQQVIADNIANVETPNYKAKYVTFEEAFEKKLSSAVSSKNQTAISNALNGSYLEIQQSNEQSSRTDGNNVNADTQLIQMTKTSLHYQYSLNALNSDITRYRTIIKGL